MAAGVSSAPAQGNVIFTHEKLTAGRPPWLSLLALCALFELPALLLPEPLRLTGELVVVLLAWLGSLWMPLRVGRALRVLLGVCSCLLVLVRIDRVGFREMMGEEPLLYDQMFLVRHLFVLIDDVWSLQTAVALSSIALVVAGVVWLVRRLLGHAALLAQLDQRDAAFTVVFLGALAIGGTWIDGASQLVRWMTPPLIENVQQSRAIYRQVQRAIRTSAYRDYGALQVKNGPDVYLVFVESYGRVIATHPEMRERYIQQMSRMQQTLTSAGWSMASAYTKAPVMGGRSWLAEGSVIMGMHVGYEALFRQLVGQIDRVPNLVSFLKRQGYHTVLLAPADRVRTGVEAVNYYRYDQTLGFDDLNYHGPHLGWGLDQYSLGYVDEHVLRKARHPLFFEFHMVTAHAPWDQTPGLVADWRELGKGAAIKSEEEPGRSSVMQRLRRYVHAERRFARLGKVNDTLATQYQTAVLYELELLERHLAAMRNDALVIVLGDHQPPFLAAETRSFDTPLHVFARNRALLDEFMRVGFRPGLWLPLKQQRATRHEGIFSLTVRALMRSSGAGALPTFLWAGAPLEEPESKSKH